MLSWNWRYSGWHRSGRWVTGKMSGQWLSTVVSHLHNKLRDVSPHLHGYYSPPSSWIRTTIFFFSPYVDFCIFKGSSPSIFSAVLLLDLHHPEFHHAYIVTIIRAPSHLSISAQVAVLCSSILLHYTALLFFFLTLCEVHNGTEQSMQGHPEGRETLVWTWHTENYSFLCVIAFTCIYPQGKTQVVAP